MHDREQRPLGAAHAHAEDQPVLRSVLEAAADRVVPTTLAKATLTELCHTLEDQLLHEDLAGVVVAGFQRARYWEIERERYRQLCASSERHAIVFAADAAPVTDGVTYVQVDPDHPLAREWFVIALTERFSAVLFGRELTAPQDALEHERTFLSVWSFDPIVVEELLGVLEDAVGDLDAPVAEALVDAATTFRPRRPATGSMPRFVNTALERLETRRLPDRREPSERGDGVPDGDELPGAPPGDATQPDVPARRALIVDAEPAIRGLLEALLRRAGWQVRTASSLLSAQRKLPAADVDVLLLDVGLEGGDVHSVLRALEVLRPGVTERTVLLSAAAVEGRTLHGRPVAAKPLVWADLERTLRQVVARSSTAL
ncbi:MAG: DICT sensory domain-containing protein [Nitriliruptoraceae bacterium]